MIDLLGLTAKLCAVPSVSREETALADDVAAWCQARGVTRPVVLGHSMGGKTAMVLALRRPDLVSAVIVVDIAPVAYRHDHHGLVQALREHGVAAVYGDPSHPLILAHAGLDGGRVFRSLLWWATGNHRVATRIAVLLACPCSMLLPYPINTATRTGNANDFRPRRTLSAHPDAVNRASTPCPE